MNTNNVGIFLDIENLLGSLYATNLPLDIKALSNLGKKYGNVIFKKSYGDIFRALKGTKNFISSDFVREQLALTSFDIEDIPYTNSAKNSADMSLALGCYKKAVKEKMDIAIIISEDKDFIPLYKSLRELGKQIILVTINKHVSEARFQNHVTEIVTYQSLLETFTIDSIIIEDDKKLTQKDLISNILQITLPDKKSLLELINLAKKHYFLANKKLSLTELTQIIAIKSIINQDTIYKILLSLAYSKVFELETPIVKNNPIILNIPDMSDEELYDVIIKQFAFLLNKHYNLELDKAQFEE